MTAMINDTAVASVTPMEMTDVAARHGDDVHSGDSGGSCYSQRYYGSTILTLTASHPEYMLGEIQRLL